MSKYSIYDIKSLNLTGWFVVFLAFDKNVEEFAIV